ncbi:hypothetical protein ANAPC5_00728 [Anaplasma phagocytophilum]|nr:hypothetical protein ANAPC5_00728 [Anaplasma phagocytophilum]
MQLSLQKGRKASLGRAGEKVAELMYSILPLLKFALVEFLKRLVLLYKMRQHLRIVEKKYL